MTGEELKKWARERRSKFILGDKFVEDHIESALLEAMDKALEEAIEQIYANNEWDADNAVRNLRASLKSGEGERP